MSVVSVGESPVSGLAGFLVTLKVRSSNDRASKAHNFPLSGSPIPVMTLIPSNACMLPTMPGNTPSTPASAQLATAPGAGGYGYHSRQLGPRTPCAATQLHTATCPANWQMDAYTWGVSSNTQASLTK